MTEQRANKCMHGKRFDEPCEECNAKSRRLGFVPAKITAKQREELRSKVRAMERVMSLATEVMRDRQLVRALVDGLPRCIDVECHEFAIGLDQSGEPVCKRHACNRHGVDAFAYVEPLRALLPRMKGWRT